MFCPQTVKHSNDDAHEPVYVYCSQIATIHLKLEIGKLDQECTLHG
jgi:hypothetical protein